MQTEVMPEANFGLSQRTGPSLPARGLSALLAIASPRGIEAEVLRKRLGLTDAEYKSMVETFQRNYMVDVVSYLDGERVREGLRLTDYGQSVLTSAMEKICVLPE